MMLTSRGRTNPRIWGSNANMELESLFPRPFQFDTVTRLGGFETKGTSSRSSSSSEHIERRAAGCGCGSSARVWPGQLLYLS